ncbi:MAG: transcription antiterminator NusG [Caulobacteraceae bacterium]|nr:transcription antiterminator NusG [Caulobacteraceae bacterium]
MVDPGSTGDSREIIERYRRGLSEVVYDPDRGRLRASIKAAWHADPFHNVVGNAKKRRILVAFLIAFRLHAGAIAGRARTHAKLRAYRLARFREIIGRNWRPYDHLIRWPYPARKYTPEPRSLWQRLRYGSAHGRFARHREAPDFTHDWPVQRIDAPGSFQQTPIGKGRRARVMTQRLWYAVHTQPQRERLASEQLVRQGFEVFYPRQIRTARHARRVLQREVSYFPNYLFVALDLQADLWRRINGTLGVRSLVMAGDRPAMAASEMIDGLRAACGDGGLMMGHGLWKGGEQVRVLSGPFADQLGIIDRLDGLSRVRLLMSLLGARVPVVTSAGNLALAS